MDLVELERFIVAAKAASYVGGGSPAEPSRPGSHDLRHSQGEWHYCDSYFGGTDFIGQEVVWRREQPVWAMNYYGWIIDDSAISAAQAGRVIKTALSELYAQGRFLGGHQAQVDGWEYHDEVDGDVSHFEGREQINRPGGPRSTGSATSVVWCATDCPRA